MDDHEAIKKLYTAVEYTNRHLRHTIDALRSDHIQNSLKFHDNKLQPDWCAVCIILQEVASANTTMIVDLQQEQRELGL
jgi:hypothetical protein